LALAGRRAGAGLAEAVALDRDVAEAQGLGGLGRPVLRVGRLLLAPGGGFVAALPAALRALARGALTLERGLAPVTRVALSSLGHRRARGYPRAADERVRRAVLGVPARRQVGAPRHGRSLRPAVGP